MSAAAARDRWIPWIFVAGFAVVVAVNAVMVWLALSTFSGLSTEQAYDRGLAYNRVLAEQVRQDALGWRADIASAGGTLRVALDGPDGAPLAGARVTARLTRPVEAGAPLELAVRDAGAGRFVADLAGLRQGLWDLHLRVEAAGTRADLRRRLVLP